MTRIEVEISSQRLTLYAADNHVVMRVAISTSGKGVGERHGSEQTPRGRHIIRAKIGAGAPANTVWVGRRVTGEIYSPSLRLLHPQRDWILTRIMWLSGCEVGYNRLGSVDTMRRYIYIHGCPDEDVMGIPSSHGCIKMRNDEIVSLFDLVSVCTPVNIVAEH